MAAIQPDPALAFQCTGTLPPNDHAARALCRQLLDAMTEKQDFAGAWAAVFGALIACESHAEMLLARESIYRMWRAQCGATMREMRQESE